MSGPPAGDAPSPDGAAPGTIALHVQTQTGAPAVDAYVVLDDDTVLRTDASGRAVIPALASRTFHVVHPQATAFELGLWRVVSLYEVDPESSIELGPPPESAGGVLDLTAIPDGAADTFRLYGPTRCGRELIASNATTFNASYPGTCQGTTAELFLLSELGGVPQNASQSPSFTYGDGVDVAFGAWTPAPTSTIRFSNIPVSTTEINAQIFHEAANGDMYIVTSKQGGVSGEELVIDAVTPLAANHVAFIVTEGVAARGAITPLAASGVVDISALPSLIGPLNVDAAAQTLAWDDVSGGKLVIAQSRIDGMEAQIQWTALAPSNFRSVTFPALPAELAAIAPATTATFNSSTMVALFSDQVTSQRFRELIDSNFVGWFAGLGRPPAPVEILAATVAMP